MAIRFAVFTILSIALCFLTINVGRDPKKWRLLWLDFLSILDVDTSREQRRMQERQLAMVSYFMFVLFLVSGLCCAFWTFDQVREQQRVKTAPERDLDYIRKQIDEVAKIPRRR